MDAPRLDPALLDRAFAVAARQVADGRVPFVVLGIGNAAGTVRLEAVSAPDRPRIGADAVCLLASVTKPIVATAVLQVDAEGSLPLGRPLADVVPRLAATGWRPFGAWHVLSHTSGLGEVDLEAMIFAGADRDAMLDTVHRLPQGAAPGSTFRYASAPFDVLAEALERLDGIPWDEAVRRRVLEPLGMASTALDPRVALATRMAPVRVGGWDGTVRSAEAAGADLAGGFIRLGLAGGGLWGSAADLLRFGRAMLRGGELDGARVLSPAYAALATREVTRDGLGRTADRLTDEHYALGWGRPGPDSPSSPAAFGHGGVSGTRLWVDPAYDLVIVYLSGVWGLPSTTIDEVVHAVYAAVRPAG